MSKLTPPPVSLPVALVEASDGVVTGASTIHCPAPDAATAPTLVILPVPEPARVAPPLPPVPADPYVDREPVRFRDETAMYPWSRMRPNTPADPNLAEPRHADPTLCTVRLKRTTPDTDTMRGAVIYQLVHPEMKGDYLCAGWEMA